MAPVPGASFAALWNRVDERPPPAEGPCCPGRRLRSVGSGERSELPVFATRRETTLGGGPKAEQHLRLTLPTIRRPWRGPRIPSAESRGAATTRRGVQALYLSRIATASGTWMTFAKDGRVIVARFVTGYSRIADSVSCRRNQRTLEWATQRGWCSDSLPAGCRWRVGRRFGRWPRPPSRNGRL